MTFIATIEGRCDEDISPKGKTLSLDVQLWQFQFDCVLFLIPSRRVATFSISLRTPFSRLPLADLNIEKKVGAMKQAMSWTKTDSMKFKKKKYLSIHPIEGLLGCFFTFHNSCFLYLFLFFCFPMPLRLAEWRLKCGRCGDAIWIIRAGGYGTAGRHDCHY